MYKAQKQALINNIRSGAYKDVPYDPVYETSWYKKIEEEWITSFKQAFIDCGYYRKLHGDFIFDNIPV